MRPQRGHLISTLSTIPQNNNRWHPKQRTSGNLILVNCVFLWFFSMRTTSTSLIKKHSSPGRNHSLKPPFSLPLTVEKIHRLHTIKPRVYIVVTELSALLSAAVARNSYLVIICIFSIIEIHSQSQLFFFINYRQITIFFSR